MVAGPDPVSPMGALSPLSAVGAEVAAVLAALGPDVLDPAVSFLTERPGRWFFTGQGRSLLVAEMVAMRVMHLGRPTHVVGEASAPAVGPDDHVVALSNTGETFVTCHLARLAVEQGADLLVVTSQGHSQLAQLTDTVLLVPPIDSVQFGGSLYEQCALILLDAAVLQLSRDDPDSDARMQRRHTNLQ